MSSSRPYESKVLTFILRQFQQGLERHRRAVRQAKHTATWSFKLALSPVYAVLRATRLAGRQFGSARKAWQLNQSKAGTAAAERPALSRRPAAPPAVTFPIESVIASVQSWLSLEPRAAGRLAESSDGASSQSAMAMVTASPGSIQAVASDLERRTLILIGAENAPLDLLTAEQQLRLQQQIFALVEAYWQYRTQTLGLGARIITSLPLPAGWKQALLQGTQTMTLQQWHEQVSQILSQQQDSALIKTQGRKARYQQMKSRLSARLSAAAPSQLSADLDAEIDYLPVLSIPLASASPFSIGALIAQRRWLGWLVQDRHMPSQPAAPPPVQTASLQRVSVAEAALPRANPSLASELSKAAHQRGKRNLDAEVTQVTYIEHPLEKGLRWIDRLLSWLETLWQRLRIWWHARSASR
ncbi:MAG: hypothetical protein F6J97_13460 [Leptolyngbya sp. SIO4C1]|nr:hypothetical protein [Leptolyngbya sp. SIO4C1]